MNERRRDLLALARAAWIALRQRHERRAARRILQRYDRDAAEKWREALAWLGSRSLPTRPARVACVVSCHDDWEFLPDLLLSLRDQTLSSFEIVLVDDASSEARSVAMREELRRAGGRGAELVELSVNVGLPGARNRGIGRVSAEVVACVDADDILAPSFLDVTASALEEDPKLGFAYFDHFEFGDVEQHVRSRDFDLGELERQNYVVAAAPFRRKACQQVGGYREDLVHGYEDWDLWIRLAQAGWPGRRIHRTLFFYRKRKGSLLEGTLRRHEEAARLVRAGRAGEAREGGA